MDPRSPSSPWDRICPIGALLLLGGLAAAICLAPPDLLVGSATTDLSGQFLAWRAFAAEQLRAGHLPGWNPFTYAGEPFLGGFQSAVFYPPNLLFLVLPIARAVNLSLLLHLFILAAGLDRWARRRGLHPLAAALGGFLLALSGPVFPHLYAGHLSNLCTLAWAPWVFAGAEAWARRGDRRGLLLAAGAAAMQLLAGHLQYAYYTAIAVALQAAVAAWTVRSVRRRALAAAQLLPGLAATREGLRQARLDPAFAAQFSLPPENLLTAVAPGLFGTPTGSVYWGRCYEWEMSLFLGVTGAVLLAAALADPIHGRSARRGAALAAALLGVALGCHTPWFPLLYGWVPGLDRFRGWSKFSFPADVLLALVIAQGADAVIRGRLPRPRFAGLVAAPGALGLLAGAWLGTYPLALAPWLARVQASGESYLPAATFADPATLAAAAPQAAGSIAVAGGLALVAAASLLAARRRPALRWLVPGLLPLELLAFAASQFATFRAEAAAPAALRSYVGAHPGDYRVQNLLEPNNGFLLGAPDIWGNDPGLPKRYAEFMAFSQGADPDHATQNVTFRAPSPLYALLRLRYVFNRTADGFHAYPMPGGLDRIQLVSDYRILNHRDGIFAALAATGFDPRRTVLLESPPAPRPAAAAAGAGSCRIVASSPDAVSVEADVVSPALLLVTDGYSRDWHAYALPGSSQREYRVMPADYVLRATPLGAGHHRIEFRYEPTGLHPGIALSVAAWVAWAVALAWPRRPQPSALI
jgi:hypothetical protein